MNLESLVSSPVAERTAFIGGKRSFTTPGLQHMNAQSEEKGVKLRKSKLAKRQLRLEREEVELMRMAMQCWAKAKLPKGVRGKMLGQSGEDSRRTRSLTCP